MKTIVALRLSALGDVAMVIPVLKAVLDQHPDLRIVFVTREAWLDLLPDHPRLLGHAFHKKGRHRGLFGLWRLYRELSAYDINGMADLHEVLRTKILRFFFMKYHRRTAVIDKGRAGKKALTRSADKVLKPLMHTTERYAAVFERLGYPVRLAASPLDLPRRIRTIGIAPFAAHRSKAYPLDQMKVLIDRLLKHDTVSIVLYGGGPEEAATMSSWAATSPRVTSTHALSLGEQITSMTEVDIMICMDSANMHLASLMGLPALSIWGGTHPYAGFTGYRQPSALQVERHDLDCRPCSVFGTGTCARGDWACMDIAPSLIEAILGPMLDETEAI